MEARKINEPTTAITLLHNEDAEKSILSIIAKYPSSFSIVREKIDVNAFYEEKNRKIFDCMKRIADKGEEITITRIMIEAQKQYPELAPYDISDATMMFDCGSDVVPILNEIKCLKDKRELMTIGNDIMNESQDYSQDSTSIIARARKSLDRIDSSNTQHIYTLADSISNVSKIVMDNQSQETMHKGTHTGFDWFDNKGGFQATDLIIVAAESSQGKTSFALSVINNAIASGAKIAFYSMEMTKEQLAARLLAMNTNISSGDILNRRLNDSEYKSVNNAMCNLTAKFGSNIYFDDRSTSNLDNIIASIRAMKMRYNIEGVVIDYLQILRPERGMSKEQFIGEAARRLKDIAKELEIWVMALSQLSRDRDNPEPNVNRLRDSGQINEASDLTILIYRPEAVVPYSPARTFPSPYKDKSTNGTAMVTIAKGRNVGLGSFLCRFNSATTHFYQDVDIPTTQLEPQAGGLL